MPTLVAQTPDTLDLDYFYTHYARSFGIAIYEEEPDKINAIPIEFKPTACFTKNLRNYQTTHFLPALSTTQIVTYLCGSFHTNFDSGKNQIYNVQVTANPTTSNRQTKKLSSMLQTSTQTVSVFSTPIFKQHTSYQPHQLLK